jgi:glyoxylase-like metal-dependent hydrolase (beta-lactamase superfamily II)
VVDSGYVFSIDGVDLCLLDLGPGESHSDGVWIVDTNGRTHAFVGDLVFPGAHAFFQDGHAFDWRRSLSALEARLSHDAILYPGHGPPGGRDLLRAQIDYISFVLNAVDRGEMANQTGRAEVLDAVSNTYPELEKLFRLSWSLEILESELRLQSAREALTATIQTTTSREPAN